MALLSVGVAVARVGQGRLVDRVGFAALPAIVVAHVGSAALVLAAPAAVLAPAVLLLGLTAPAITVVTQWLWAPGVSGVAVAIALIGAVLANASVTLLLDLAARAAASVRAEGFGWSGATLRLGNAAGAGAAGLLAEHVDPRAALAVALAGAVLATVVVCGRRAQPA